MSDSENEAETSDSEKERNTHSQEERKETELDRAMIGDDFAKYYKCKISELENQMKLIIQLNTTATTLAQVTETHTNNTSGQSSLTLIPIFKGESNNNEEFKRFIHMFKKIAGKVGGDDHNKQAILESKLQGRAKELYFDGIGQIYDISLEERLECLHEMFWIEEGVEDREERFYQCKQKPHEGVKIFRRRLESLAAPFKERLTGDEEAIKRMINKQFMRGLKTEIAREIAKGGIKEYEENIQTASRIEKSIKLYPTNTNKQTKLNAVMTNVQNDEITQLRIQLKEYKEEVEELKKQISMNKTQVNNGSAQVTEGQNTMGCAHCGKGGHSIEACYIRDPNKSKFFCKNCEIPGHSEEWCRKTAAKLQNLTNKPSSIHLDSQGHGTRGINEIGNIQSQTTKIANLSEPTLIKDYKNDSYLKLMAKEVTEILKKLNDRKRVKKNINMCSLKRDDRETIIQLDPHEEELPTIEIGMNGMPIIALLDTGASSSLINSRLIKLNQWITKGNPTKLQSPITSDWMSADVGTLEIEIGGKKIVIDACAAPISTGNSFDIILGFDFFRHHDVTVYPSSRTVSMKLGDREINTQANDNIEHRHVFKCSEIALTKETVPIKLIATIDNSSAEENCLTGIIKDSFGRFTSRNSGRSSENKNSASSLNLKRNNKSSELMQVIHPEVNRGRQTKLRDTEVQSRSVSQNNLINTPITPSTLNYSNLDIGKLTNYNRSKLISLIDEFGDIMIEDVSMMTGARVKPVKPEFTSDIPVNISQYHIPHSMQEKLKKKIDAFERAWIVSRGGSRWNVPLLCIDKPNGDIRIVLDLRKINEITHPMPYPLQRMEDIIGSLNGSSIFSKVDMNNGYFQIPLDPESREKFSFSLPWGKYHMNRLPQGCVIAASVFQSTMNDALSSLITDRAVMVYQDDILVHSPDMQTHMETLQALFSKLREINMAIRPSKCSFCKSSVEFLGHVINEDGAKPTQTHLEAIKDFPQPKTVREVRSFLGTINFYRKFIPGVTNLAAPLYNLLKKNNKKISWDNECELSFKSLKTALISAPLLVHPNFSKPFFIKSDASNISVGGVLEQEVEGEMHPVAYCSRKLNKSEQNFSCIEKEALAILYSLRCFRHLVYGYEIILMTDHKPLTFIFKLRESNQRIARWMIQLQDYRLKVRHLPGSANVVADMLSRGKEAIAKTAINSLRTTSCGITMEAIRSAQQKDKNCIEINKKIEEQSFQNSEFELDENCLIIKRVFFGNNRDWNHRILIPQELKNQIIRAYHDPPFGAHFSYKKVVWKIKKLFTWEGMFQDIKNYIMTCIPCQRRNLKITKAPFQPVSPPSYPFEKVSVDVLGPLSQTERGNRYVLLWVDHFTRYPIASAIPNQEAETIAREYIDRVYSDYGGSRFILSDRGANFTSGIFTSVCRMLGAKNLTTTSFRPNSNGVTERSNRTILNILSHICNGNYNNWDTMLPHVLKEIRGSPHTSTGESPAYLLYGFDPIDPMVEPSFPDTRTIRYHDQDFVEQMTGHINDIRREVANNLINSSEYNCLHRNKGRRLMEFEVGSRVWLHDNSSHSGKNRKLKPRYKGPYQITERRGLVNYYIRHVKNMSDIQLVHVDRLKKAYERKYLIDSQIGDINNSENEKSHVPDFPEVDSGEEYFVFYPTDSRMVPQYADKVPTLMDSEQALDVPQGGHAIDESHEGLNENDSEIHIEVRNDGNDEGIMEYNIHADQARNCAAKKVVTFTHPYQTRSKGSLPKDFFQKDGTYLKGRKYNG